MSASSEIAGATENSTFTRIVENWAAWGLETVVTVNKEEEHWGGVGDSNGDIVS